MPGSTPSRYTLHYYLISLQRLCNILLANQVDLQFLFDPIHQDLVPLRFLNFEGTKQDWSRRYF